MRKPGLCTQNTPVHIKLNVFIIIQAICNLRVALDFAGMTAQVVKNLLKYHVSTKSYLILKFRNVVKFYVHIRPIFSCRVTI